MLFPTMPTGLVCSLLSILNRKVQAMPKCPKLLLHSDVSEIGFSSQEFKPEREKMMPHGGGLNAIMKC